MGGSHLFQPGNTASKGTGNRPKNIGEMREIAKVWTADMIHTMVQIAMDTEERGANRIAAAEIVLKRAWGSADAYHAEPNTNNDVTELSSSNLLQMLESIKADMPIDTKQLEHIQDS